MFTQAKLTTTKTSNELLIDFLEKKGLKEKAESLGNGATSLDLGYNHIGSEGARVLADALKTNSSITSLDLAGNQIGAAGARVLADALKTNSSITSLDLDWNQIRAAGARVLADTLKTNSSITSLDLGWNQIGAEGARVLADTLNTNSSITLLYLGGNEIGAEGAKEIEGYIQRNKKLAEKKAKTLNIQGDIFCGKGEYDKAIEKYNKAIAINKKPLYVTHKTNAEKKYFEQLILVIKENKTEEAEKLVKQMDAHILNKVTTNGNTALTFAAEKGLEKVCELLIPKMSDQAINQVNNYGETALTYAASKGLEKVCEVLIPKMTEQAVNAVNHQGYTALNIATEKGFKNICDLLNLKTNEQNNQSKLTEKINIFQELVNKVNTNIASNATINAKDKSIMKDTIKDITDKIKVLHNTTDIEKITNSLQKLLADKPVKSKLMAIDEQLDEIIEQQTKPDDNITVNKVEIIYDSPLLNHPELLQAAVNSKLSSNLIQEAINNNDEELILAGLMSVGHDVWLIN